MDSMAFENYFVLLHKSFHVYAVQLKYNFVALWLEVLLKYVANCRNACGTPISISIWIFTEASYFGNDSVKNRDLRLNRNAGFDARFFQGLLKIWQADLNWQFIELLSERYVRLDDSNIVKNFPGSKSDVLKCSKN